MRCHSVPCGSTGRAPLYSLHLEKHTVATGVSDVARLYRQLKHAAEYVAMSSQVRRCQSSYFELRKRGTPSFHERPSQVRLGMAAGQKEQPCAGSGAR